MTESEAGSPNRAAGERAAAAPEQAPNEPQIWNMFVVDDEEDTCKDIKAWFEGETFSFGKIVVDSVDNFADAAEKIRSRKIDILILDVYMGGQATEGARAGVRLLDELKKSGFVCTIFYTGLVAELTAYESQFVRVVKKDAGNKAIQAQVEDLFAKKCPQMIRGLFGHVDKVLASYLWGFVEREKATFKEIQDKPDFLRLLAHRLGDSLGRDGAEEVVREIFGASDPGKDKVHATEIYIKPPLLNHPVLGDIRVRKDGGQTAYYVVVWPSCDLVEADGRTPKVAKVLVVRAVEVAKRGEVIEHLADPSKKKQRKVLDIVKNQAGDRYHFLPKAFDIPDLVVDFGDIEAVKYEELKGMECLATMASPYAESLASRFQTYSGRLGTKDLDVDAIVERIAPVAKESVQ